MISAEEAREISKEHNDNLDIEQLKEIEFKIESKAAKGGRTIGLPYEVRKCVKEVLQRNGYEVSTSFNQIDGGSTSINW